MNRWDLVPPDVRKKVIGHLVEKRWAKYALLQQLVGTLYPPILQEEIQAIDAAVEFLGGSIYDR